MTQTLPNILLDIMPAAGADGLIEIPIAVTGNWKRGESEFSITRQDLAAMAANFKKRKNGEINVDYDHASEMPEVARGGPVPSAGRIVKLRSNGALYAGIEFTARALAHIKAKEYRFVSPAIAWGMKDKATGEDQGTTLTSLALTNRPFLEELPPIKLSEITPGDSGLEVRRGEKTMPTAQSELIKLTQAKMKSEGKTFSEALISVAKERPELCAEARHEILEERPVFEPPREEEKVEPGPAQARFIALAKSKMANEHISFSEAFNIVCREQPLLASDYREEVIGAKF